MEQEPPSAAWEKMVLPVVLGTEQQPLPTALHEMSLHTAPETEQARGLQTDDIAHV